MSKLTKEHTSKPSGPPGEGAKGQGQGEVTKVKKAAVRIKRTGIEILLSESSEHFKDLYSTTGTRSSASQGEPQTKAKEVSDVNSADSNPQLKKRGRPRAATTESHLELSKDKSDLNTPGEPASELRRAGRSRSKTSELPPVEPELKKDGDSSSSVKAMGGNSEESATAKRPGRPKKVETALSAIETAENQNETFSPSGNRKKGELLKKPSETAETVLKVGELNLPAPKRPGRPKKVPDNSLSKESTTRTESEEIKSTPLPKQPGRPHKVADDATSTDPIASTHSDSEQSALKSSPGRRPGRPKRVTEGTQSTDSKSSEDKPEVKTLPRRPGRPAKSSTGSDSVGNNSLASDLKSSPKPPGRPKKETINPVLESESVPKGLDIKDPEVTPATKHPGRPKKVRAETPDTKSVETDDTANLSVPRSKYPSRTRKATNETAITSLQSGSGASLPQDKAIILKQSVTPNTPDDKTVLLEEPLQQSQLSVKSRPKVQNQERNADSMDTETDVGDPLKRRGRPTKRVKDGNKLDLQSAVNAGRSQSHDVGKVVDDDEGRRRTRSLQPEEPGAGRRMTRKASSHGTPVVNVKSQPSPRAMRLKAKAQKADLQGDIEKPLSSGSHEAHQPNSRLGPEQPTTSANMTENNSRDVLPPVSDLPKTDHSQQCGDSKKPSDGHMEEEDSDLPVLEEIDVPAPKDDGEGPPVLVRADEEEFSSSSGTQSEDGKESKVANEMNETDQVLSSDKQKDAAGSSEEHESHGEINAPVNDTAGVDSAEMGAEPAITNTVSSQPENQNQPIIDVQDGESVIEDQKLPPVPDNTDVLPDVKGTVAASEPLAAQEELTPQTVSKNATSKAMQANCAPSEAEKDGPNESVANAENQAEPSETQNPNVCSSLVVSFADPVSKDCEAPLEDPPTAGPSTEPDELSLGNAAASSASSSEVTSVSKLPGGPANDEGDAEEIDTNPEGRPEEPDNLIPQGPDQEVSRSGVSSIAGEKAEAELSINATDIGGAQDKDSLEAPIPGAGAKPSDGACDPAIANDKQGESAFKGEVPCGDDNQNIIVDNATELASVTMQGASSSEAIPSALAKETVENKISDSVKKDFQESETSEITDDADNTEVLTSEDMAKESVAMEDIEKSVESSTAGNESTPAASTILKDAGVAEVLETKEDDPTVEKDAPGLTNSEPDLSRTGGDDVPMVESQPETLPKGDPESNTETIEGAGKSKQTPEDEDVVKGTLSDQDEPNTTKDIQEDPTPTSDEQKQNILSPAPIGQEEQSSTLNTTDDPSSKDSLSPTIDSQDKASLSLDSKGGPSNQEKPSVSLNIIGGNSGQEKASPAFNSADVFSSEEKAGATLENNNDLGSKEMAGPTLDSKDGSNNKDMAIPTLDSKDVSIDEGASSALDNKNGTNNEEKASPTIDSKDDSNIEDNASLTLDSKDGSNNEGKASATLDSKDGPNIEEMASLKDEENEQKEMVIIYLFIFDQVLILLKNSMHIFN